MKGSSRKRRAEMAITGRPQRCNQEYRHGDREVQVDRLKIRTLWTQTQGLRCWQIDKNQAEHAETQTHETVHL